MDHATYALRAKDNDTPIDEIDEYWRCRYLTGCEAAWRMMGYHIARKEPAVTPLPIHLPTLQSRQYARRISATGKSNLEHYFLRPHGNFQLRGVTRSFEDITYDEYYTLFRLVKFDVEKDTMSSRFPEIPDDADSPKFHVLQRTSANEHLSRIQDVRPTQGETFYLRVILQHKPCRSFEDARTVNGRCFPSYQAAAMEMGLFADVNEGTYALQEAVHTLRSPHQLRLLFVHLLINDCIQSPIDTWQSFRDVLCQDFVLRFHGDISLATRHSLQHISRELEEHGKSPTDFGLEEPDIACDEVEHELGRWQGSTQHSVANAIVACDNLFPDQREIFDTIMQHVTDGTSLCAFIDGKAGRGKTVLVNAICDMVRSLNKIVLPTATSAFAAQLYPGGRTTHSTFKVSSCPPHACVNVTLITHQIPVIDKNELLLSPIESKHSRAELIRQTAIIIWDEAPMANKAVFNCVHEVCCKCMSSNEPFGGKIIVLLGDFRQTCPVIRGGSKSEVDASIKSSPLWQNFTTFLLCTPIRNASDLEYAAFTDEIGDGLVDDVSFHILRNTSSENDVVDFVYPPHILSDPDACLKRAILAPTNRQIDTYNTLVLGRIEGVQKTYIATDSLKEAADHNLRSPNSILDYVRHNPPPGIPNHTAVIKTNCIYRLLRNFSVDRGLVKNARVCVVDVGLRLITVRLLGNRGNRFPTSEDILIPRITFTAKLPSGHTLHRQQFPLAPAYAATFNSCQGLTLDVAGVDLTTPVFSHGQLYTALSRIRHRNGGIVRLPLGTRTSRNVTYRELLQ